MENINIICTDIGTKELKNQDSACIKRAKTSIGTITMAVVCDGVNGMSQGEMASSIIVQKFGEWFLNELPEILEKHIVDLGERLWKDIVQAVKVSWKENLQEAHKCVAMYGVQQGINIGSTFTGIILFDNFCSMIMHVGDSRAYKISKDIRKLTVEQTLAEREVERGSVSREEAKKRGMQNVLLQCVGASKIIQPDILIDYYEKNAIYLLCTDGFWKELTDQELKDIYSYRERGEKELQAYLKMLIEKRKSDGEKDNITVLAVTNG